MITFYTIELEIIYEIIKDVTKNKVNVLMDTLKEYIALPELSSIEKEIFYDILCEIKKHDKNALAEYFDDIEKIKALLGKKEA